MMLGADPLSSGPQNRNPVSTGRRRRPNRGGQKPKVVAGHDDFLEAGQGGVTDRRRVPDQVAVAGAHVAVVR